MAISEKALERLEHAVVDRKLGEPEGIGDEIAARLAVQTTPATAADAQKILDLLDKKKDKDIERRLEWGLAGDGSQGLEIAHKLVTMIECLEKYVILANLPVGDPGIPAAQAALNTAKAKMGSKHMSEDARFHLEHALADKAAADEIKKAFDAMVDAIQAL